MARKPVQRRFRIPVGPEFDLRLVLFSHGWIDLAPFDWNETDSRFTTVVAIGSQAVDLSMTRSGSGLAVRVSAQRSLSDKQVAQVRGMMSRMLRLDEDLAEFWAMCAASPRLTWVARRQAGRIFRCPTVFEDLFKLLFTTNCSWAATRLMTQRLIDALGAAAPSGRRAFPSPQSCADQDEAFYREVVRAGYRAKSCIAIADAFASGAVDEHWFTDRSLPIEELRQRLLDLPGFGPYAAGQAMRTLGQYKDLALDSWCRSRLAEMAGRKKPPSDRTVAQRYRKFHPYDGLALWMDLTGAWHGES